MTETKEGKAARRYVRRGMTLAGLAEWLGVRPRVLHALVRAGHLEVHRLSARRTVVLAGEINRFLASTSSLRGV